MEYTIKEVTKKYNLSASTLRYYEKEGLLPKIKKNQSNQDLEGCKKFEDHWHSIIQSSSEDEFNQRVQKFEDAYLPQYHQEVGYIKDQWLGKYKEKIVNNWVNQHRHFGNVVTS